MTSNSDIFRRAHQMARRYPAPMPYRQAFSFALKMLYAAERKKAERQDPLRIADAPVGLFDRIKQQKAARAAVLSISVRHRPDLGHGAAMGMA